MKAQDGAEGWKLTEFLEQSLFQSFSHPRLFEYNSRGVPFIEVPTYHWITDAKESIIREEMLAAGSLPEN